MNKLKNKIKPLSTPKTPLEELEVGGQYSPEPSIILYLTKTSIHKNHNNLFQ